MVCIFLRLYFNFFISYKPSALSLVARWLIAILVNSKYASLLFRDEFYALAVFSGHTHHINTRLIGTHVEDSHVTIDIAFVNHLTEATSIQP